MRKGGRRRRNLIRWQKEAAAARRSRPSRTVKRRVELAVGAHEEPLQELYGETRLVVMTVDPYLIHAYWEVTDADLKKARTSLGREGGEPQPVLRFHDISCVDFDGTNAHCSFDVEIDLRPRNWYVRLWSADKTYCVDLGLRDSCEHFAALARSNMLRVPRAEPSTRFDERLWNPPGDQGDRPPLVRLHPAGPRVACEAILEASQRTGREVAPVAAQPPCIPASDDPGKVAPSISVAPPDPGSLLRDADGPLTVEVKPAGSAGAPDLSLECERQFLPGLSSF